MSTSAKLNATTNSTRTAVALAFGLAVGFVCLFLLTVLPTMLPSFKEAYQYSIHNPGAIAQSQLLLLFVALTCCSMLNGWAHPKAHILQKVIIGITAVSLLIALEVVMTSTLSPDTRNGEMFIFLSIVLMVAIGMLMYMSCEALADHSQLTSYMVINAMGFVGPVLFLVFDGTRVTVAWTIGLWFMMHLLPSTEVAAKATAEVDKDDKGPEPLII